MCKHSNGGSKTKDTTNSSMSKKNGFFANVVLIIFLVKVTPDNGRQCKVGKVNDNDDVFKRTQGIVARK